MYANQKKGWRKPGGKIWEIELRRILTVLREDKGRKSAELMKNSLEDLLEINQVYKIFSDDTRDGIMFREIETRIGKRQIREGVT